VRLSVVELSYEQPSPHVRATARKAGSDWMILIVNEDDEPRMAVSVDGLDGLNGRALYRLYGAESVTVTDGSLAVRLRSREVQLYCTDRKYETQNRQGRDYSE
jgi:hypothetical protein